MAIFELGIRMGFDRVSEGFTGGPSPTVRFFVGSWWDRGRTVVAPWSDHHGPRLTSIENQCAAHYVTILSHDSYGIGITESGMSHPKINHIHSFNGKL